MSNPWLRCKYCGCDVWASTVGGDIENHNCKDQQIADLKEKLEAWRNHWREDSGYERHFTEALKKLKDLGEI